MKLQPTVFLVDDDPGMRKSTGMLLQAANLPCEVFESAADFMRAVRPETPGCLLLDLHMPEMNGLQLIEQLRAADVHMPILMVSGAGTVSLAVEGMKLGAVDFLEKPVDHQVLLQKVQTALRQDADRRLTLGNVSEIRVRLAQLTGREREVLRLLIDGLANKQVAATLGLSVKTVENHRARLMEKTGALNAADLVRMALQAEPNLRRPPSPT